MTRPCAIWLSRLGLAILPSFIAAMANVDGRLERILRDIVTRRLLVPAAWPPATPMPEKLCCYIEHLLAELKGESPWRVEPLNAA